MQNYSDEELVAKYKESRDHQYLTVLFTRHSDIIYRNVLRKMRNPSDAEDVVQTAYCKMMAGLLQYKGTGSVLGWMLQVSLYTCYEVYRSEKGRINREKKVMAERGKEVKAKNYELTEMIENHLNKLPEIYKVPITLQIMDGLTIKEVAEVLEKSEKTVRSQIARGLEKLKVSLQNVGVTASVVSIGEVLKEIQLPVAPEAIKSSQFFNTLYQKNSFLASKALATSGVKFIAFKKAMTLALIITTALTGYLVWENYSKTSLVALNSEAIFSQKWDFENTSNLKEYLSLGVTKGGLTLLEKRGENNSNALLVEAKSLIVLDISKFKLPIRISYKTDYFFPKIGDDFGQMVVKDNYEKDKNLLYFNSLRERIFVEDKNPNGEPVPSGKWYSNQVYIDEKSVDFWVEGKRSQILYGETKDHKTIYLSIYGKAIIDNLLIEAIDRSSLPDTTMFEKIISSFEFKEKVIAYDIEKSKLGLNQILKVKPQMHVFNMEEFGKNIGVNLDKIYPSLNKDQKVVWVSDSKTPSQKWDFEKVEDLQHFNLIHGMFAHGENKGANQSNCVGMNAETVLEFDISKFKLPIKISYLFYTPFIEGKSSKGCLFIKNNYQKNKNILLFTKLSPPQDPSEIDRGWFRSTVYVTEESIDYYLNDFRTGIIIGQSVDNKKMYIYLKDVTYIDEFIIESVLPENTPSVNEFIKFGESIPLVKKFKDYYPLGKEKLVLNLDAKCKVELGICTSEVIQTSFYLDKKREVIPINSPTNKQ